MRIFFSHWIFCLYVSQIVKGLFSCLALSGGQQSKDTENEYDSLASSVADDDSTGMVGPSQPQQPPQLQRRQRRPALRNNQPNSVQSPAADKEGKTKKGIKNTVLQILAQLSNLWWEPIELNPISKGHSILRLITFELRCKVLLVRIGAVISKRLVNLI